MLYGQILTFALFVALILGISFLLRVSGTAQRIGYIICGVYLVLLILVTEAPDLLFHHYKEHILHHIAMYCVWLMCGCWVYRGLRAKEKTTKPKVSATHK